MTYEKSRATWNSGFRGYKNSVTGKLTPINWDRINRSIDLKQWKNSMNELVAYGRTVVNIKLKD